MADVKIPVLNRTARASRASGIRAPLDSGRSRWGRRPHERGWKTP